MEKNECFYISVDLPMGTDIIKHFISMLLIKIHYVRSNYQPFDNETSPLSRSIIGCNKPKYFS